MRFPVNQLAITSFSPGKTLVITETSSVERERSPGFVMDCRMATSTSASRSSLTVHVATYPRHSEVETTLDFGNFSGLFCRNRSNGFVYMEYFLPLRRSTSPCCPVAQT